MAERSGIEIDYCPQCRGVWLDRGELDKIIERNAQAAAPAPDPGGAIRDDFSRQKRDERYPERYRDDDDYYKRKKKKNLLDELFDF
jgi:hypothetical protein